MRWDELFADLEAQLAAEAAAEQDAEVADRTRREAARLTLVDRALGAVGCRVAVRVPGAGDVLGVLREVGAEWLLVDEDGGRTTLVPLAACLAVTGLTARTDLTTSAGRVFARLGLGSALRAVARDRSAVSVWLVDGSAVSGTVDRVGADFVEVSERPADDYPARATAVRTVPFAAIGLVRSQR
jgi:hypothetical protein